MREILFRGKCPITQKWVYGDLFQHGEQRFIMADNRITGVLPETVGEYTGLTDKNGVKIFEGDILSSDEYPYTSDGNQNYFAEVLWFDDCPAFGLYTFKSAKSLVRGIAEQSTFIDDDLSDMEVIGNIHDNPELMKGDEPT